MIPMRVPFLVIMWTCYDCELLTVVFECDRVLFSDMPVDRLSSNRRSIIPLDDAFEGGTRKRSYFTPGHQNCEEGKVRGTIEVMLLYDCLSERCMSFSTWCILRLGLGLELGDIVCPGPWESMDLLCDGTSRKTCISSHRQHPCLSLSPGEHTEIVFLGYEIFHLGSHLRRPEDQTGSVHTTHITRGSLLLMETWCLSSQASSPATRACSWGNLRVHRETGLDRAA
jgi:hypothetical protein